MPPASGLLQLVRANPIAGVIVIIVLLCTLMAILKVLRTRRAVHPELLRKVVHILIGLVTLSFPWLFAEPWPVIAIAAVSSALMVAVKAPGPLRKLMGGVVDGVER